MSDLVALQKLFAQLDLFEPDLGRELAGSSHILTLGLGRSELVAWEASHLGHLSLATHVAAFDFFVNELRLPNGLRAAVTAGHPAKSGRSAWQGSPPTGERLERVRLNGAEFELALADDDGRHQVRLVAPPLPEARRLTALDWLASAPALPLRAVARGAPLELGSLKALDLVPAWTEVRVVAGNKGQRVVASAVNVLCRAMAMYPAYVLIWRGLGGKDTIGHFVARRLAGRQRAFQAVVDDLPAAAEEFWAAPDLPALPALEDARPGGGLAAHLPRPTFWPRPEDNELFMVTLARAYRSVPRKILQLLQIGR